MTNSLTHFGIQLRVNLSLVTLVSSLKPPRGQVLVPPEVEQRPPQPLPVSVATAKGLTGHLQRALEGPEKNRSRWTEGDQHLKQH